MIPLRPTVIAVTSILLQFHFTNLTENHRNACEVASNELQPGVNAQCPLRVMRAYRFELSMEAFHFYGSAEVLRKSYILRNSDGLYYGRARFLRKNLATVSI